MSAPLTDLAGWKVYAEDFLAVVLQTTAQPIWVVDADGLVRFANAAAVAALGYDSADELCGRPSHETIRRCSWSLTCPLRSTFRKAVARWWRSPT